MKIEKLNDNQIRCTLTSADLSARNLNLSELAYGSDKARLLFNEMIETAYHETGFEAEDIPIMVEAIPLPGESIMLLISKVDDPEELDTRFSHFSPSSEEAAEAPVISFPTETLEGSEDILNLFNKMFKMDQSKDAAPSGSAPSDLQNPQDSQNAVRIFTFDNLEQVEQAAAVSAPWFEVQNSLYKNPKNGRYYLYLTNRDADREGFVKLCNLLSEYGTPTPASAASSAYLDEHYELFIKKNALKIMSSI